MSFICPDDLTDHEQQECYYRKGGIPSIGVLKTGHGITNFSSATQINAAIADGTLKILKKLKAEVPAPSAVEGENPTACGADTILDGHDYVVNITDFNVNPANDELYGQLNRQLFAGIILYFCEEQEIRVKETGVTFSAGPVYPKSNKEKQHYVATAKWSQSVEEEFPVLHEAPDGVF